MDYSPNEICWYRKDRSGTDRSFTADFPGVDRVTVEIAGADLYSTHLRAKSWRVTCGNVSASAEWLTFGNFQFDRSPDAFWIEWTGFPYAGLMHFGQAASFGFETDTNRAVWLLSPSGAEILKQIYPWKDSQRKAGAFWVSQMQARAIPDAYAAVAAGMLGMIMQIQVEIDCAQGEFILAPLVPRARPKPAKITSGFPVTKSQAAAAPLVSRNRAAEKVEIPWEVTAQRSGIVIVEAKFPSGTLTVERLGQSIFNPYGSRLRIIVGHWIVALDKVESVEPTVWSDEGDIHIQKVVVDGSIYSGRVEIANVGVFEFEHDKLSGWILRLEGKQMARLARPWKDEHLRKKVQWVTYLESDLKPWPEAAIALGVMDTLRYGHQL